MLELDYIAEKTSISLMQVKKCQLGRIFYLDRQNTRCSIRLPQMEFPVLPVSRPRLKQKE